METGRTIDKNDVSEIRIIWCTDRMALEVFDKLHKEKKVIYCKDYEEVMSFLVPVFQTEDCACMSVFDIQEVECEFSGQCALDFIAFRDSVECCKNQAECLRAVKYKKDIK